MPREQPMFIRRTPRAALGGLGERGVGGLEAALIQ